MPVSLSLEDIQLDDILKGFPGHTEPMRISEVGEAKWNVLSEDFPLPLAVLKQSAMDRNSKWMQRFLASSNAVLAPHGKTTMCPQLFYRQLADGAWGITLGNIAQVQVARRFGIPRIILANQLVGRSAIKYVLNEMRNDPDFDFYCLVDSVEGVSILAEAAERSAPGRPLQILVEGGVTGRRAGARTLEDALCVARAVKEAAPHLALRGVEGFEGVILESTPEETAVKVTEFLNFLSDVAVSCQNEGLFADGVIILTAGGTAFYDLVTQAFSAVDLGRETLQVIRSGCYLTHDSIMYDKFIKDLIVRNADFSDWGAAPQPALEVWAYVQSRPETSRVILSLGKRDASYDAGLPIPVGWARPGKQSRPSALETGHVCIEINDQHLFMDVPENSPLRVGDMVGFGISHPCLTFDKWQFIPVVDDAYSVISAVRTYF